MLAVVLAFGQGCGGDDDDILDAGIPDTGPVTPGPGERPDRPELGEQIDRAGRPAINLALIGTFDQAGPANELRDAYNQAGLNDWGNFTQGIQQNLAVYDGLNRSCGSQAFATPAVTGPERYAAFAQLLANDRLVIDSEQGRCEEYMAVELAGTALGDGFGGDCGGRTPRHDVVDRTLSVLIAGDLDGVTDGITGPTPEVSIDDFPFLAAPVAEQ